MEQPFPIAILGAGIRLPGGANSLDRLWPMVRSGRRVLGPVPPERWNPAAFYDPDRGRPAKYYIRAASFLEEDPAAFDAAFFGIQEREARYMDPHVRLCLELVWEAFESAGLLPQDFRDEKTAVFLSSSISDYTFLQGQLFNRLYQDGYQLTGGGLSMLANRISYHFDFRGSSIGLDTACSASHTALYLACREIWSERARLVVAGGVSLILMPYVMELLCLGGFLSPDGASKAFDARADGYGRGEGAGVFLLAPLEVAVASGWPVLGCLLAAGANQDGRTAGITVPSLESQRRLIEQTWASVGLDPSVAGYVEAHGTGTPIGDPIEARALGATFGKSRETPCPIGSLKANIGHLEAAAGAASLAKALLVLREKTIPPLAGLETPNPAIPFEELNLGLPREAREWSEADGPRLLGLNGFGYGGSNCHLILGEAPPRAARPSRPVREALPAAELLPLSAHSEEALRELGGACRPLVRQHRVDSVASAFVRQRTAFASRAVACGGTDSLETVLGALESGSTHPGLVTGEAAESPEIVFVFSGMAAEWIGMGRELFGFPAFRTAIEEADEALARAGGAPVGKLIGGTPGEVDFRDLPQRQAANWAVQLGLARLLREMGIVPSAVIGHSLGEVAAACVAGALSLEDSAGICHLRATHQERSGGAEFGLLALEAEEVEIEPVLQESAFRGSVEMAAVNGPRSVTLAGKLDPLRALAVRFEKAGRFQRIVETGVAYHSSFLDANAEAFETAIAGIRPRQALVPFVSTVYGRVLEGTALDARYWRRNFRDPVLFHEAVTQRISGEATVFLQIGGHPVLRPSLQQIVRHAGPSRIGLVHLLEREQDGVRSFDRALAELWVRGAPVSWSARLADAPVFDGSLPRSPFRRKRLMFETPYTRNLLLAREVHPLLGIQQQGTTSRWSRELDFTRLPWLPDHRVDGAVLLPAAAFMEAALGVAATKARPESGGLAVANLRFSRPVVIGSGPYPVLETELDESGQLTFRSRTWDARRTERTERVADAELLPAGQLPRPRPRQNPEPAPGTDAETSEDFLRALSRFGFQYGPAFQGVEEFRCRGREGLARVRCPGAVGLDPEGWRAHPVLLDAALQSAFRVLSLNAPIDGKWLPVSARRIVSWAPLPREFFAYTDLLEFGEDHALADLILADLEGDVLLRIDSVACRRFGVPEAGAKNEALYDEAWLPLELTPQGIAPKTVRVDQLPSFASDSRFEPRVRESGLRLAGEGTAEATLLDLSTLEAPSTDGPSEIDRLLRDLGWELIQYGRTSLIPLSEGDPRVAVLFRRSIRMRPEDPAVDLLPAALLGSLRSMMNERQHDGFVVVDLPADPMADPPLEQLLDLLRSRRLPREAVFRDGRFFFREVVRLAAGSVASPEALASEGPIREDRSVGLQAEPARQLDSLRFRHHARRPPGPGEVELRVRFAAINFKDVLKASRAIPEALLRQSASGTALGLECSGVVVEAGAGTDFRPGDPVLAWGCPGAFQTHVTLPAGRCLPQPDGVPPECGGAQAPLLTAWRALVRLARLQPGETLLVHSATGGVGHYALQIARMIGATVFATAGTEARRRSLREQGIEVVESSRDLAFADAIRAATRGRGVDVVLNSLTGEALRTSFELLAPGGRFVELGKRDILEARALSLRAFDNNTAFLAIDLDRDDPALLAQFSEDLQAAWDAVRTGRIRLAETEIFPASDAADAFQKMGARQHLGRLALDFRPLPAPAFLPTQKRLELHPDRTWLVTGGLGEIGWGLARWLVDQGIRSLWLAGRSTPPDDRRQAMEALEARGIAIRYLQGDVADPETCREWFRRISEAGPPLGGVIHAAGLVRDSLVDGMTREDFEVPFPAKVAGVLNLDRLTREAPELEHFIGLSSVASCWGTPGQSNYACANSFMDALMERRLAEGLPAASFHLGPVAGERSMAVRFHADAGKFFESAGVPLLSIEQLCRGLSELLPAGRRRATIANVDWPRLLQGYQQESDRLRFRVLFEEAASAREEAGTSGFSFSPILDLPPDQQRGGILERLKTILALEGGLEKEIMDPKLGLRELGLDSLRSIALDLRIREEFGVTIPFLQLFQEASLESISEQILTALLAQQEKAAAGASDRVAHPLPSI